MAEIQGSTSRSQADLLTTGNVTDKYQFKEAGDAHDMSYTMEQPETSEPQDPTSSEGEGKGESNYKYKYHRLSAMEKVLAKNLRSADMKIALYISAYDCLPDATYLRPFPPGFHSDKSINEEKLHSANEGIPTMPLLHFYLQRPYRCKLSMETLDVIYWNLICLKEPRLVEISPNDYNKVLTKVNEEEVDFIAPNVMFKLMYTNTSNLEMKWQAIKERNANTKFGYFSTEIHNYHSLLYYGLESTMQKDGIGGVLLSKNLSKVHAAVDPSWMWGKSTIGLLVTLVSMVEYIDDSSVIRNPEELRARTGGKTEPDYFMLTDPNKARLRYLLVYTKKDPVRFGEVKEWSAIGVHQFAKHIALSLVILSIVSVVKTNNNIIGQIYSAFKNFVGASKEFISPKTSLVT